MMIITAAVSTVIGIITISMYPVYHIATLGGIVDPRDILLRVQTRPRAVDFYGW
jgi:hypothetical protein